MCNKVLFISYPSTYWQRYQWWYHCFHYSCPSRLFPDTRMSRNDLLTLVYAVQLLQLIISILIVFMLKFGYCNIVDFLLFFTMSTLSSCAVTWCRWTDCIVHLGEWGAVGSGAFVHADLVLGNSLESDHEGSDWLIVSGFGFWFLYSYWLLLSSHWCGFCSCDCAIKIL